MNNFFDASTLIAFVGLLLALTTTICGAILWYVQTEKKKYAAERDFNHLKRNIEQLTQNVGFQAKALEEQFDQLQRDILEIKFNLGIKKGSDRPARSSSLPPWQQHPNNRD
ncbi:MAG: hypothetical protein QNJ51_13925 [Calothrix sp. MO_167.B12]|nr:hypothetical protein [Calothrix sp. MO_167.B12]